jgi:sensor domain CHASE-containing protein
VLFVKGLTLVLGVLITLFMVITVVYYGARWVYSNFLSDEKELVEQEERLEKLIKEYTEIMEEGKVNAN